MRHEYGPAAGFLWEIEKKLLTRDQWQSAIDAPTADEAIRILGDDYSFNELESVEFYEQALQRKLAETYQYMYTLSTKPELVDILNLKYQFHNLKVLVKASVSAHANQNSAYALSMISAISPEDMVKSDSPKYLSEAYTEMERAYTVNYDPQAIDMEADSRMFKQMLILCECLECTFVTTYVKSLIDMFNLKLLMRAQRMQRDSAFLSNSLQLGGLTDHRQLLDNYDKPFSEIATLFTYKYFGDILKQAADSYDEANGFSTLEKLCDNLLMTLLKQSKYLPIGPEMIFTYILVRENEISRIRMLLACKVNGIPNDVLHERLCDLYG